MTIPKGKVCKFCKHVYMKPCHGKNKECGNAVWIRSGGKVNPYSKEKITKKRIRLDSSKSKPKKRRVRL